MRPQKITFSETRSRGGPTGILVYCADYRCSHSIEMSADRWPDNVRLSDIERPTFGRGRGGGTISVLIISASDPQQA